MSQASTRSSQPSGLWHNRSRALVYNLTPQVYGLSNLALRRLKVARFSELNDPFELLAIDLVNPDLRAGIRAKNKLINDKQGLICFSRNWRSPLLWSHYADCHRGIALGFEVPEDLLTKVRYVGGMEKLKLRNDSTSQSEIDAFLDRLRFTKFRAWEYEEEVRQFVDLGGLSREAQLYFLPFSSTLVLRQVILGVRCDLDIEAVRKLVARFPMKVHVTKARIAYSKFGVTEDERYRMTGAAKDAGPAELLGGGIASLLDGPEA